MPTALSNLKRFDFDDELPDSQLVLYDAERPGLVAHPLESEQHERANVLRRRVRIFRQLSRADVATNLRQSAAIEGSDRHRHLELQQLLRQEIGKV